MLASIIAVAGVIITALLTFFAAKRGAQGSRVTHLETRLNTSELVNKGLWIWNIGLQSQVLNREPPPPIAPPEWLKDILDK